MQLEQERRRAEDEAARLEAERQLALLAKEELARQAEDQMKSQEQLVRTASLSLSLSDSLTHFLTHTHTGWFYYLREGRQFTPIKSNVIPNPLTLTLSLNSNSNAKPRNSTSARNST